MSGSYHPAYFETRFRHEGAEPPWPGRFAIVSAHATTGDRWPDTRNRDADERLAAAVAETGVWRCRVTGYSPDTGHAEPSWAIAVPLEAARALGTRFLQDAIYWVEHDALSVVDCSGRRDPEFVGRFSDRIDPAIPR